MERRYTAHPGQQPAKYLRASVPEVQVLGQDYSTSPAAPIDLTSRQSAADVVHSDEDESDSAEDLGRKSASKSPLAGKGRGRAKQLPKKYRLPVPLQLGRPNPALHFLLSPGATSRMKDAERDQVPSPRIPLRIRRSHQATSYLL